MLEGAKKVVGRRHSRYLVRKYKPTIVILVETHCPFSGANSFWKRLGYSLIGCSEANGHSGGIWILTETYTDIKAVVDVVFHQAVTVTFNKGVR